MIAIQALHKKYGFGPDPDRITLLESDGEGGYILFKVGEHEYRCDDGEITNIEEQKQLDEEADIQAKANRMLYKDLADLRDAMEKQEKLYTTKELMLTEAYNAKRAEIETLEDRIQSLLMSR